MRRKEYELPLRLLADECIQHKILVARLRAAGHDVITASEAGLIGKRDEAVFQYAINNNRLVFTTNCIDFVELSFVKSAKAETHPGILLLYQHNDPTKDMSYDDIVLAIATLEATLVDTTLELTNGHHSLNSYNCHKN